MKTLLIVGLLAFSAVFSRPIAAVGQEHEHQHHQQDSDRDRDRWMWQQPEKVMNVIGVRPGMVVADVGAGDGYFTSRLSQRVGSSGKVYAEDIDEHGLRRIRENSAKDGLGNVETILGKENDPLLPERSIDLAIMVNVIHFLSKPGEFLNNVKAGLKPGATLVVVQWDSTKMSVETEMSRSDLDLYSQETVLKIMEDSGYEVVSVERFLPVQNIFICRPS